MRHIAQVMQCSPATVKQALAGPHAEDMSGGTRMSRMCGGKPI